MTVDEELWNTRIMWHELNGDMTDLEGNPFPPTQNDYVCQKFIYQDGFMASAAVNGEIYACDSCWMQTVSSEGLSVVCVVASAVQNTMSQIVTGRQYTGQSCLMINNVTALPLLMNDDGTVGVSVFKGRKKEEKPLLGADDSKKVVAV